MYRGEAHAPWVIPSTKGGAILNGWSARLDLNQHLSGLKPDASAVGLLAVIGVSQSRCALNEICLFHTHCGKCQ